MSSHILTLARDLKNYFYQPPAVAARARASVTAGLREAIAQNETDMALLSSQLQQGKTTPWGAFEPKLPFERLSQQQIDKLAPSELERYGRELGQHGCKGGVGPAVDAFARSKALEAGALRSAVGTAITAVAGFFVPPLLFVTAALAISTGLQKHQASKIDAKNAQAIVDRHQQALQRPADSNPTQGWSDWLAWRGYDKRRHASTQQPWDGRAGAVHQGPFFSKVPDESVDEV
jgi:hypothetical protein